LVVWKGIQPAKNLATEISKDSAPGNLWGAGLTWSDIWENRPVQQKMNVIAAASVIYLFIYLFNTPDGSKQ